MFLVLLSHSMDDLPYGLFPHRKQAVEFGESLKPELAPTWWHNDASTPICVNLVELQSNNCGGFFPIGMETIKSFSNEEFIAVGFVDYNTTRGPTPNLCETTDGRDPLNTPEFGGEA